MDPGRALLAAREAAAEQLATLQRDFGRFVEASRSVSTDDEHDPEGATIAFERAQVSAMVDQTARHLADLDAAAERLSAGTYGWCEVCGRAIGALRLEARPAASRCIACAGAGRRR
jgi:RNA polymerase-binding transcription factor DksA